MRLLNKRVLLLVADGVELAEYEQLRRGFEAEGAEVVATTNLEFITVESVYEGQRGRDILIDIPFEGVEEGYYDGLVLPDGYLSVSSWQEDGRVLELIRKFHRIGRPIFASGQAAGLLYEAGVLSQGVLVREGTPLTSFITQAISVLTDSNKPKYFSGY